MIYSSHEGTGESVETKDVNNTENKQPQDSNNIQQSQPTSEASLTEKVVADTPIEQPVQNTEGDVSPTAVSSDATSDTAR